MNMKPFVPAVVVTVVVTAAALLTSAPAHADCASSAFRALPQGPLPTNGQILIEGYALTQPAIVTIAKQFPVLVGGGETVPLDVRAMHPGGFQLTQAVMAPSRPLKPNTRYELKLLHPSDGQLEVYADGKRRLASWTTAAGPDTKRPTWRSKPSFTGDRFTMFGCGPAVYVDFAVATQDDGAERFVLAEVTAMDGRREQVRYILPVDKGRVALGHGMCSGAFRFAGPGDYEVVLTPIDAAGNLAVQASAPIRVKAPTPR